MLDLPPAAHYHVTQFLSHIWLQTISTTPSRVSELIPIWCEMADYLFTSPKWQTGNAHDCQEVWGHIFLYGSHCSSADDEDFVPLVKALYPLFERHVKSIAHDPYGQSSFARFLTTKSGEQLLVDAFAWLYPSWSTGSGYFWGTVVEHDGFPKLLEHAWRNHFSPIRRNAVALRAFKTLTLKLAAHQDPVALEVQNQIGTTFG